MDDSETGNRTGAPRTGSIPTGEIDVLYVDGDDEAWLALGEHVDQSETVRVEQVTDPAAARSLVERGGIDVIVVTADVPGDEGDSLLETATPTILYTDIDPWNIDDSVLGAVDSLVENAVDPMYVVDENGTIQVVNESMTEFVGRKKADIVGADVRDILPLESINAGRGFLRRILSDDEVENESFEMWMTNADGEKRFFEVTISAITENGEFGGSVATYRDITERHRRQEQLDLRKQIFARSLRHNIRNETSIIHSYGTILADELDGEHAAMAEAILDANQSLAGTSRKVSQFDWLVEKEPELVDHDLFALVKRSIEQVRSTTDDANISIEIPDGLQVRAVRDLDVAIKNLVENALQHGTTDSAPSVSVTARETTESVTLVVADDGPGIPQQEIAVIEEGRETALDHASGLGLWLVKRVITQSGGDLSFEVGDGTRVEVTFPRVPDTQ